jgi:hypothetical protein
MMDCDASATEINTIYNNICERMNTDILSAIEVGFREGLTVGVWEGILSGLNEGIDRGLLNVRKVKIRNLEEILIDVASETLESLASSRTKAEVCPVIIDGLRKQCDQIIHRLTVVGEMETAYDAAGLLGQLNLEYLADKKMKELSRRAEKELPSNFVVYGVFRGMQKALWDCTKKGIENCLIRIRDVAGTSVEL